MERVRAAEWGRRSFSSFRARKPTITASLASSRHIYTKARQNSAMEGCTSLSMPCTHFKLTNSSPSPPKVLSGHWEQLAPDRKHGMRLYTSHKLFCCSRVSSSLVQGRPVQLGALLDLRVVRLAEVVLEHAVSPLHQHVTDLRRVLLGHLRPMRAGARLLAACAAGPRPRKCTELPGPLPPLNLGSGLPRSPHMHCAVL
jgi:hypothetical protein